MGKVRIAFADGAVFELKEVALVSECESNFISLGQLCNRRISYQNKNPFIILMQDGVLIAQARKNQNLFILNLATPKKVMQANVTINNKHTIVIIGQRRPTYLVNCNKKV